MAPLPFCLDIVINSDLIALRCAGIIKPSNNTLLSLLILQPCSCFSSRAIYRRDKSGFQIHIWYMQVQHYLRWFLAVSLELPPAFYTEPGSVCLPFLCCWAWGGFKRKALWLLAPWDFSCSRVFFQKSVFHKPAHAFQRLSWDESSMLVDKKWLTCHLDIALNLESRLLRLGAWL